MHVCRMTFGQLSIILNRHGSWPSIIDAFNYYKNTVGPYVLEIIFFKSTQIYLQRRGTPTLRLECLHQWRLNFLNRVDGLLGDLLPWRFRFRHRFSVDQERLQQSNLLINKQVKNYKFIFEKISLYLLEFYSILKTQIWESKPF